MVAALGLRQPCRRFAGAFTLVELLVVIAIVFLLLALVSPLIRNARQHTRAAVCKTNLRTVLLGVRMYANEQRDWVVPSFTMSGTTYGSHQALDGWAPSLNKEGYVYGNREIFGNPFVCPEVTDEPGITSAVDQANPDGYMDWPTRLTENGNFPAPIPLRGFPIIIRTSYWINGENPIGTGDPVRQGIHFTGSAGYGPDAGGLVMRPNRYTDFREPSRLIAFADGVYAGNQNATQFNDPDTRISYRHPGTAMTSNIGFADGHVGSISGYSFPRRAGDRIPLDVAKSENLGSQPTVYADPIRYLAD